MPVILSEAEEFRSAAPLRKDGLASQACVRFHHTVIPSGVEGPAFRSHLPRPTLPPQPTLRRDDRQSPRPVLTGVDLCTLFAASILPFQARKGFLRAKAQLSPAQHSGPGLGALRFDILS